MTSDPSMVDTPTLFASLNRDLAMAQSELRQANAFLNEARATLFELQRRAALQPPAPADTAPQPRTPESAELGLEGQDQ
jgi:hypothetical protein